MTSGMRFVFTDVTRGSGGKNKAAPLIRLRKGVTTEELPCYMQTCRGHSVPLPPISSQMASSLVWCFL